MAAVLLALRVLGWVLLAILLLLLLVLFLPVGVELRYSNGDFSAKAAVLCFRFTLYPRPEKPEKEKSEKQKQKEQKAEAKKQKSKAEKAKSTPQKKHDLHITLETVLAMIGAAGSVMKRFFAALHFRKVRIYLPVCGTDAAETAIRYGQASAWAYSLQAGAQNLLDLEFEEFRIEPDFAALGTQNRKKEHFSCKITTQLYIMVITAVYALIRLKNTGVL